MNRTNDTVIIAHDFLCPWCWLGLFHAQWLKAEFPNIRQDWRGYELLPESLGPLPDYTPKPRDPNKPPSRLDLLSQLDGIPIPQDRTIGIVRTHDALQGCEYFKEQAPNQLDAYIEAVYRAFWERSEDISNHDVLGGIVAGITGDATEFLDGIKVKKYSPLIVPFDDAAYADDITHVPTFVFRGERCAEAPYATIREIAQRFVAWYQKKA